MCKFYIYDKLDYIIGRIFMKKKIILILVLVLVGIFVSGCSKISEDNYFIKGQALKLMLNYVFCQNDLFEDSHRIILGTQVIL